MPTMLIKEVRQKLSLCLVGSPGIQPSSLSTGLFVLSHLAITLGFTLGAECKNAPTRSQDL